MSFLSSSEHINMLIFTMPFACFYLLLENFPLLRLLYGKGTLRNEKFNLLICKLHDRTSCQKRRSPVMRVYRVPERTQSISRSDQQKIQVI
jgi:hypothetical protein